MMKIISNSLVIARRELKAYFESPVAYVFLIAFLVLTGFLTFSVRYFFERMTADLTPFFSWLPWVFLVLVPAATMGLWADERRSGTIELLLTMPVTLTQVIAGKFLASWIFISTALVLTFPIVLTTVYLGEPDLGVIAAGYCGAVLMAAAYVAIGMFASSITKSQVISFVASLSLCLVLVLAGWPPVTDFFVKWAPLWLINGISSVGFMPHYDAIQRGVIDLKDIVYFASVVILASFCTYVVLENRKSA
jgi:ABC-2 type transport system permease protein